jgi:CelD/BcsL family acetyltransferase involved in cellulose biosynthesis
MRVRTLSFICIPDTQFCDLLSPADWRDTVARAVAQALHEVASEWDVLDLSYLSDAFPNWRALHSQLLSAGLLTALAPAGRNLRIALDQPWSAYYANRSRSLKKKNNLAANRLERSGRVQLQWLRNAEVTAAVLDEVIAVSARSWKGSTGLSLDKSGPNAFVRRLSELAAAQGWLSVWILRINGTPIAAEYQLIGNGAVHALRSDFDESHAAASPGSFLNWKLLEQLFAAGQGQYFMGPGENAYKLQWSSDGPPMFQLQAFSPNLRGRALGQWDMSIKPALRALRERLRHRFGGGTAHAESE